MRLLSTITGPSDLRRLTQDQLNELTEEIRQFLISAVSATGGHLGPNLGVIELTVALHRVFESPHDTIVFDTGHQSYVHKLLTGRQDFSRLRRAGGLSGYPSRAESVHDVVDSSHASSSLSWADGISKARRLTGADRHTVAVIGDGALTGGMAWEALNNIAASNGRLVVVVNDNERSYAPTVGGLAHHLGTLRTTNGYEKVLDWGRHALQRGGPPGRFAYDTLHGVKKGIKDVVAPQGLFEDLGLKYIGPVDGHNVAEMEHALRRARAFDGPVLVHAITRKGNGYAPARADQGDQFHSVGVIDPDTGKALTGAGRSWTAAFADEMVTLGAERPDVVGITAAMLIPVGLHKFAAAYPDRVFDVGIAEQHALTSAAGLAFAGLHPVVAIYATFMNRAFDQVLMDVGLHNAGVTMVLDRAGVTGPDGASHHGMWDLPMLSMVPGIAIAAPRDTTRLVEELREAVDTNDRPTVLRIAKDDVPEEIAASARVGGVDVLHADPDPEVLVVCVGSMASVGLEVAGRLAQQGLAATVVDPRWVLPVPSELVRLAGQHRLVVTIEDGLRAGGVGTHICQAVLDAGHDVPVRNLGLPTEFLPHGTRNEVLAGAGLTAQDIARDVVERMAGLPETSPGATRLDGRSGRSGPARNPVARNPVIQPDVPA